MASLGEIRLAMVGPIPPPYGGMAMQTRQLVSFLEAEGIHVTWVAVNPPYQPRWIAGVQGVRALFRLVPYLIRLWRVAGQVDILHVMANSGWSWHLFAAPALWIGALRHTPVVLNYRGGAAADFLRVQSRWVVPSLRRAACTVVPSAFLHDVFRDYGIATEIIPNAVDRRLFYPRPQHGSAAHDAVHLIVTRNLEAIYDVATAIRAFHALRKRLPAAHLTIAGSGPERDALQTLVRSLALEDCVHFTGSLGREAMAELYRSADLLLNSSLADNMPNSLLEAMACGVPIISTDAGGIPLLITHGHTGLLVACGDWQGMANAALRVVGEARLRARLREAGLDQVTHYAWPTVKPLWLSIYQSVIHPGNEAASRTG